MGLSASRNRPAGGDRREVPIDRLFVEPLLTRRHVSPDEDPSRWRHRTETIFDALGGVGPLMLLGDPGTGKSTLLNYLAWLLARPTTEAWLRRMGAWLLPVPMLLRELQLDGVETFEGLLGAFLHHAIGEPLRDGEYVKQMIEHGRALLLLDGIDETGEAAVRHRLRKAVLNGFARYPRCRWLLASRVVGYDEASFDAPLATARGFDTARVVTRYVAPFDDERIMALARKWYARNDPAATRSTRAASDLVRCIRADETVLVLGRIPRFLTMMARLHRKELTLPHGRARLCERIAEACLDSLDACRGVHSVDGSLTQKMRWLARVGYEMQRRSAREPHADIELNRLRSRLRSSAVRWLRRIAGQQLLFPREAGIGPDKIYLGDQAAEPDTAHAHAIVSWVDAEMKHGNYLGKTSARRFLDFIVRA